MSVSRFPYPITTNFIPEAWDFTILNRFANFILTYPVAQGKVVFQTVSVGTATLLTQIANTAYVFANVVPYLASLLSAVNTWTGSNQFNSIKVDTLANMTLNDADFAGTTTLTNSTFNQPFTPIYNPITIPVGAIGYRAPITFLSNSLNPGGGTAMRSCSVTQGTWIIYWYVNFLGVFAFNFTLEIQTAFGRRGTQTIGNTNTGGVRNLTIGGMTYFGSSQTVTFRGRNDSGGSLNNGLNPTSHCVAYRIA